MIHCYVHRFTDGKVGKWDREDGQASSLGDRNITGEGVRRGGRGGTTHHVQVCGEGVHRGTILWH